MNKQPEKTVRIQLDKNTVVYVREGVDIEAVKEKFANRNNNRSDYGYLFDYGNHNQYKPKRNGRVDF
jgi:hypothetical protein